MGFEPSPLPAQLQEQIQQTLLSLALALGACGSPAAPPTEYDVVAEAMKAFDKSDWVLAARLLREAVVKQPTDVRLHYSRASTSYSQARQSCP